MNLLFAVSLLISSSGTYSASSLTGAMISSECEKSEGLSLDPCVGYVVGVADALSSEKRFCLSGASWTAQVVAVSRQYLRDHPEEWNLQPAAIVRRALIRAFPCASRRP
jgi:hypothetical protein